MLYKENWDKVVERYDAWWKGEIVDRVLMQVYVLRPDEDNRFGWDWLSSFNNRENPERTRLAFEDYCRTTYFGAEAFPNLWINLGPGIPAAFFGCTPESDGETIWFNSPEKKPDWDQLTNIKLDKNNYWYKKLIELTDLACAWGEGKYHAGLTDLNSVHDILCHLYGTQDLLYALIDNPDAVKTTLGRLNDIWLECFDITADMIVSRYGATANWMNVWSRGRWIDVQCDFSAMIGPEMFEEFVMPYLEKQCAHADHTIFHLDGPDQIKHLDMLLDLPDLDGIQWVPGAGAAEQGDPQWYELYHRVLDKGKILLVQGLDARLVEPLLRELPANGLLLETKCETVEEAESLIKKAAELTHGR